MATSTSKRTRFSLRVIAVAVLIIILLGVGFALFAPMKPKYGGLVAFVFNVTYAQALRAVTDLGLQTVEPCSGGADKSGETPVAWTPESESDLLASDHRLWVGEPPIAAPYWPVRLRLTSGVTNLDTGEHTFSCPVALLNDVAPDPVSLTADQAGTYSRVTFDSVVSYDDALAFAGNYGLRLADPCMEQSWMVGKLPWSSAGQEGSFSASHSLILATTRYAATIWREQLQTSSAQSTVSHVESPINLHC